MKSGQQGSSVVVRSVEVFWRFLLLGLTSFGGPTAHIGYFHRAFVGRLQWMSERTFVTTVALCQFLPGPASSQVGFAVGLHRAGLVGGLAAFIGFTLPSFLLMLVLATLDVAVTSSAGFASVMTALKLVAVAVVGHAVLGMAGQFLRDRPTTVIALVTAVFMLSIPWLTVSSLLGQLAALGLAAVIGGLWLRPSAAPDTAERVTHKATASRASLGALILFGALLVGLPLLAFLHPRVLLFGDFYRVGSLVFGGGHVVLPLLQASIDGVSQDQFLTGYAAAQGVPGPMFTFGTFLGAVQLPETPLAGALIATIAIFLPGFLLVIGLRRRWLALSRVPALAGAFAALNAAVVGLLMAALVHPVWTSAVVSPAAALIAIAGFAALHYLRLSVLWLVLAAVVGGLALGLL